MKYTCYEMICYEIRCYEISLLWNECYEIIAMKWVAMKWSTPGNGGPALLATEITKAAKCLKDNPNYKSVYINPDLSESQQIHLKRLIKERTQKTFVTSDFRYGIRGDQVVKINVKQFHHHDLL